MVKVGIKSSPGESSSKNAKAPPKSPNLFLPNKKKKTIPETGAQIRSNNSPKPGIM